MNIKGGGQIQLLHRRTHYEETSKNVTMPGLWRKANFLIIIYRNVQISVMPSFFKMFLTAELHAIFDYTQTVVPKLRAHSRTEQSV